MEEAEKLKKAKKHLCSIIRGTTSLFDLYATVMALGISLLQINLLIQLGGKNEIRKKQNTKTRRS